MRKRIKDNVLFRSALKLLCVLSIFFSSCADENRNLTDDPTDLKHWYDSKTLDVTDKVTDALQKSDVTFDQTAICINEKEGIRDKFSPLAYLNISLSKEKIEVKSKEELPVKLLKSYISSKTPYKSTTEIGADVIKVFEYDDGQVATASYGYRYKIETFGTDTLTIPHIEIDDVSYITHKVTTEEQTNENEDLYRVTLEYKISYSDRFTTTSKQTYTTTAHPWYFKVITEEPTIVKDVKYVGRFIGCPIEEFEVTETVTTNKNSFTNTYKTALNYTFKAPNLREQATLDSLFQDTSIGKKEEQVFSTNTTSNGFKLQTKTGTYTSSNKSQNGSTYVESVITFTYEVPIELTTQYGTYTIPELKLSFEELGFTIEETQKTKDEITFKTLNYVAPRMNDCYLEALEEEVTLKLQLEKDPEIVKKDSTYTLKGEDDIYEVEKIIIWSDGSKTSSTYTYNGSHSISATNFGEIITTSLNWQASKLNSLQTATKTEEKNYTSSIKIVAKYITNTHTSTATNGIEQGVFSYQETSPVVTFIDGKIQKEFPKRSYQITDLGAKLNSTPEEIVKNSISYNAYEYDHTISYSWNNNQSEKLISTGKLLMQKDKEGEPQYDYNVTWQGNTAKIKVVKTIPHTLKDDEIKTYETSFTVSLKDLTNDKIYADNTSFVTTEQKQGEKTASSTDGYFTIQSKTRTYNYIVSNSAEERTLSTEIKDAVVTFNDGTYTKDFDISLSLKYNESFASTFTDGDYNVTPHKLKLTATSADNKKSLTTTGTTDIYVKKPKAEYSKSQTWNGNTTTIKVIKKLGSNEETFTTSFKVSLSDLSNGDIYASNTSFSATKKETSNTPSSSTDGHFTINKRTRSYDYTLSNNEKSRTMSTTLEDAEIKFDNGEYKATFDVRLNLSEKEELGQTTESGNYQVTPHYLSLEATTVDNHKLTTQGITNIYVEKEEEPQEPEEPHLGKPKSFIVTATYDPTSKVTRRAFCFNWEDGVSYAVCNYETMLPSSSDFTYQVDTYDSYNSVAYTKQGSWVPARGTDDSDAMRWYSSSGSLIAGIDKAVSCKTIGWKNVTNGKYSLIIPGYTYEIKGYNIIITAPNGEKVTINSHYNK